MLILPYRLSITFFKVPYANWGIIAGTIAIYCVQALLGTGSGIFSQFVLREWVLQEMLGSMFLHGGIIHIVGNMLFLWVFGNAVCSTVGNVSYPFLYVLFGLVASALHLAFSSASAMGASGAVNGIIGMSLVMFPVSKLDFAYVLFLPIFGYFKAGKFALQSFWLIGFWLLFDVYGPVSTNGDVAYGAHVGSFIAGLAVAWMIVKFGWAPKFDSTIFDVLAGRADSELFDVDSKLEENIALMTEPGSLPPAMVDEQEAAIRRHAEHIHDLWMRDGGELNAKGTSEPAEDKSVTLPEPPKRPNVIASSAVASPKQPSLRILRITRSNEALTCYFVNDGDEVTGLSVAGETGTSAEIHPNNVLTTKGAGWLKITQVDRARKGSIALALNFSDGAGGRGSQRFDVALPQVI